MRWPSRWADSYRHYRTKVGLGPVHAAWRALRWEVAGREPK